MSWGFANGQTPEISLVYIQAISRMTMLLLYSGKNTQNPFGSIKSEQNHFRPSVIKFQN